MPRERISRLVASIVGNDDMDSLHSGGDNMVIQNYLLSTPKMEGTQMSSNDITIGMDIAKNVFHVAWLNRNNRVIKTDRL